MPFLSALKADLKGEQRQLVAYDVRPSKSVVGTGGIPVRDGRALPFVVERHWNCPAGYYEEGWYLVHPETREVLQEGAIRLIRVWGLQSATEVRDEVRKEIALTPGAYRLVFSLNGSLAAEVDVEAVEVPGEAAA